MANPAMGMRKWEAFKMALKWFTWFDVFNVITLMFAAWLDFIPKEMVADLWKVLIVQWFLGVNGIVLWMMGANTVKGFAQKKTGGE